jgi:hypothetical protein
MIPDIRRSMVWKQINPLEPRAFSKSNLMQQDGNTLNEGKYGLATVSSHVVDAGWFMETPFQYSIHEFPCVK